MTEPDLPPHADFLGDVLPAATGRRRARAGVLAATVAGVLVVAGAGVVAAMTLSGGGAQPEDVLPKDAIGFVKLDLDPSAGQKLNIYSLSKKFPDTAKQVDSADSLRDDVLRLAFKDAASDLNYDRDIKPWIGDRIGVAFLASGEQEPDIVAALAYTDRGKAEKALAKVKAEADADDPLEYALVDDYVLLSDEADVVEKAAAAKQHLVDDPAFTDAVEALDGDQIALAWTDLARVWDAVPTDVRGQATSSAGLQGADPTGQVVVGVRAEKNAVEVVGRTLDVKTGIEGQDSLTPGTGSGLVKELPAQSVAALSLSGLGESLTKSWGDISKSLEALVPDLEAQAEQYGIALPDDLATVLGTEAAVGVWGDPQDPHVLGRIRTGKPADAVRILKQAFEAAGGVDSGQDVDDYVKQVDDGFVVGTPAAVTRAGSERLGSRKEFTEAVPDADKAGFVLWVSAQDARELSGMAADPNTEALGALGVTASGGATGEFRIRLTFR